MPAGPKSDDSAPALLRFLPRAVLVAALLAAAGAAYQVVSGQVVSGAPQPGRSSAKPLEVYGTLPSFQLTSQDGASFSESNMRGKVSIANFIFTRCSTVCPVFTMKMQRVAEQTSDTIQLLSFSVDPEYDTPERLAAYAAKHGADSSRWHFLTGDPKAVRDTVEGALKMSMEREGVDENGVPDIVHATHFVLIDGEGRIRGYYNSDDVERIATMIKDAEALAQ